MHRFKRLLRFDLQPMENEPLLVRIQHTEPNLLKFECCDPEQDNVGDWFIGFGNSYLHGWKVGPATSSITLQHALDASQAALFDALMRTPTLLGELWTGLSTLRRDVLVLMVYQMGLAKVHRFRNTLRAIRQGDFNIAHNEMLDSVWADQTPRRAACMAARMRDDVWYDIREWRRGRH